MNYLSGQTEHLYLFYKAWKIFPSKIHMQFSMEKNNNNKAYTCLKLSSCTVKSRYLPTADFMHLSISELMYLFITELVYLFIVESSYLSGGDLYTCICQNFCTYLCITLKLLQPSILNKCGYYWWEITGKTKIYIYKWHLQHQQKLTYTQLGLHMQVVEEKKNPEINRNNWPRTSLNGGRCVL